MRSLQMELVTGELSNSLHTGELALDYIQHNEIIRQIFVDGVLHNLDQVSVQRLKLLNRMTKTIIEDAARGDFRLQMGKILFLQHRHDERFQRQLVRTERLFLVRVLFWLQCGFVFFPAMIILHDFFAIPTWAVFLPTVLDLVNFLLVGSGFRSVPRSGLQSRETHERALWQGVEAKLFSSRDRMYLKVWGLALSCLPWTLGICLCLYPGERWIPYVTFVPTFLLLWLPPLSRYWQTGQSCVLIKQVAVTLWIETSVIINWVLVVDSRAFFDLWVGWMTGPVSTMFVLLGGLIFLAGTTLAYPAAFVIANCHQGWHVSGICGLCMLGLEITILASLGGHEDEELGHNLSRFAVWPLLAGLIASANIARILVRQIVPGLVDAWCLCRGRGPQPPGQGPRQPGRLGAVAYILPPLLPPTISEHFLRPRWGGTLDTSPRRR